MTDPCSDPQSRRAKIGLALGAGVARGWAHIGVLREMLAHGIVPDYVAGTSIGAVVGGAYVSGALDSLEDWTLSLSKVNFFRFLDFKIPGGGLFTGERFHKLMLQNYGDNTMEQLETPFIAIGCELKTGHEIWLRRGKLVDAIQASFALPGVFEPVCYEGRWIVDGALVNPVPVSVCRAMGADIVIAVNLSEDLYGRARAEREGILGPGKFGVFNEILHAPSIGERRASRTLWKKLLRHEGEAPSIFANMVASLNVIQNRLSRSRLAGDPPDVTINVRCGHVGLMEFHRAEELIEIGHQAYKEEHQSVVDAVEIINYYSNNTAT